MVLTGEEFEELGGPPLEFLEREQRLAKAVKNKVLGLA